LTLGWLALWRLTLGWAHWWVHLLLRCAVLLLLGCTILLLLGSTILLLLGWSTVLLLLGWCAVLLLRWCAVLLWRRSVLLWRCFILLWRRTVLLLGRHSILLWRHSVLLWGHTVRLWTTLHSHAESVHSHLIMLGVNRLCHRLGNNEALGLLSVDWYILGSLVSAHNRTKHISCLLQICLRNWHRLGCHWLPVGLQVDSARLLAFPLNVIPLINSAIDAEGGELYCGRADQIISGDILIQNFKV